jgi:glycosyltransferase involved in cell wall biosynthesis
MQDARSVSALYRLVRRIKPDIAHTHTAKGGLLGTLATALAGTPVRIYQMRGRLSATADSWRKTVFVAIERLVCGASHHVICNSNSLRDAALRARLCPAHKMEVLLAGSGNGVDSKGRFNPDHVTPNDVVATRRELRIPVDAIVLGFVGRLVRDKGIGELVQAWIRLRTRFDNAHLVCIGPIEPRDPISPTDRRALESDPRVHLLGFRTDLPKLYAAMNVVILPSYREGFPNVLLEAQSMRLPVVSTRAEGCVDAVQHGITGMLVPPRDGEALFHAVLPYITDPALRERHGRAGRERVLEFFERERLWEALLGVYESMLHASKGRRRHFGTA